jgi:tetratricopeptide (TPR) repeat protein
MEEALTATGPASPALAPAPPAAADSSKSMSVCSRRARLAMRARAALRDVIRRPFRSLAILLLLGLVLLGAWMAGLHAWAYYHFRAGRAAEQKYHDAEAAGHLQECLRVWPRDPDALLLAARTARRMDQNDVAEQLLDRCAELPNRPHEELRLERLCLRADRGELDDVMDACWTRVKKDDASTPLVLEAMTAGAIRVSRLRLAAMCLERWLGRDPDNTRALLLQAVLYEQQDNRVAAMQPLARALELDPELDQARLRMAIHLVESSAAQDALPHLEYLRRRQPGNGMVQLLLARCHELLDDREEAIRILDELIERQPDFGQALAERGKLARAARQPDEEEQFLRRAASLEPGDYVINYAFYQSLLHNGKWKEAKKLDTHISQLHDDAVKRQQLVQFKLEQNPSDPDLHYQMGCIALRAGEIQNGVRWLESAVKIDPKHAPSHRMLAEFYHRSGQPGRAAQHLELARAADKEKGIDTSKPKP